jgi:hypothetical protein
MVKVNEVINNLVVETISSRSAELKSDPVLREKLSGVKRGTKRTDGIWMCLQQPTNLSLRKLIKLESAAQ